MSVIVKTPTGEHVSDGLPSFSDLMSIRAGDNKKQRIVFVNGNPTIVDKPNGRKRIRSPRKAPGRL